MPVYDFYCDRCDLKFDEFKHHYRYNEAKCPQCGKLVKRVDSMPLSNFKRIELRCQRLFGHNLKGQHTS